MPPTYADSRAPLSDEQVRAYHDNGYLIVPGLYDADTMPHWKQEVQRLLDEIGGMNKTGVHVFVPEALSNMLLEGMCDPRVVAMLNQLIGPNVEFLSVKSVYKDKQTAFGTPWHQDWFYWQGSTKISLWIALDRATPENGCLQFMPGTHKKQYTNQRVDPSEGFANRLSEQELAGLPVETIDVEPGDAVFFHDQLVHGSYPNTAGTDRWSFIATYRDAAVKDDSTTWQKPLVLTGESVNVPEDANG